MRILIKLLVLIALVVAIDLALLKGRYSIQAWREAHRHGHVMSTEVTRWLNKTKF